MSKELTPLEAFNELEKDNWFIDIYKYAYLNPANKEKLHIIEKALKALEIIKDSIPIEEEDFFYDKETDTYFFIGHKVSKEQFYLLKEVLL